jgi:zinc transport system substrate-binding protein
MARAGRAVSVAVLGSVLVLLVAGCAGGVAGSDEGRISVVASFYPLAEVARRVGGERVDVADLTPPGAEPHDLELSPDQVDAIASADVVLFLGSGFQPAVEEAASTVAEGRVVDLLDGLPTMPASPAVLEEPAAEEQDPATVDPHVWLDPELMQGIEARVERTLAEADPGSHDGYEVRGQAYAEELAAVDEEMRAGLAECERRTIVTSHAAFGYLASAYGLEQESVTGISPEAEPDPERLAQIAADVERDGTTTIYTETLVSPKIAETIARETGASTAVLNPIEGLTEEQESAGEDYVSLMQANLDALRAGLGCR